MEFGCYISKYNGLSGYAEHIFLCQILTIWWRRHIMSKNGFTKTNFLTSNFHFDFYNPKMELRTVSELFIVKLFWYLSWVSNTHVISNLMWSSVRDWYDNMDLSYGRTKINIVQMTNPIETLWHRWWSTNVIYVEIFVFNTVHCCFKTNK